eukprot:g819.t1
MDLELGTSQGSSSRVKSSNMDANGSSHSDGAADEGHANKTGEEKLKTKEKLSPVYTSTRPKKRVSTVDIGGDKDYWRNQDTSEDSIIRRVREISLDLGNYDEDPDDNEGPHSPDLRQGSRRLQQSSDQRNRPRKETDETVDSGGSAVHFHKSDDGGSVEKIGPQYPWGDVLILLKKGARRSKARKMLARLLRLQLKVRIHSLQKLLKMKKKAAKHVKGFTCCCGNCLCGGDDCCMCIGLNDGAHKQQTWIGCLLNPLLPKCVTQHSVESCDVDLVFIVSASKKRLQEEYVKVQRDDWLHSDSMYSQTVMNFITNEKFKMQVSTDKGAGIDFYGNGSEFENSIHTIFTMHDPIAQKLFIDSFNVFGEWQQLKPSKKKERERRGRGRNALKTELKKTASAKMSERFRKNVEKNKLWLDRLKIFLRGSVALRRDPVYGQRMRFKTVQALQGVHLHKIPEVHEFVHEIRSEYGEEMAWFYAYNQHHLECILFIALAGFLIQLICFGFNERQGNAIRTVTGMGITILWGPYYIVSWKRKEAVYQYRWHLEDWTEPNHPNPKAIIHDETDRKQLEPKFKRSRFTRACIRILRFIAIFGFLLLWFYLAEGFLLFYSTIRAKKFSPYIVWDLLNMSKDAVHGIFIAALGTIAFKGIAEVIVDFEGIPTLKERDQQLRLTFFTMDFWNFAIGLICMALLFQPLKSSGILAYSIVTPGSPLNIAYKTLVGSEPGTFEEVDELLRLERFHNVMIGPVVVARLFITFFFTILPSLVQRRRRATMWRTIKDQVNSIMISRVELKREFNDLSTPKGKRKRRESILEHTLQVIVDGASSIGYGIRRASFLAGKNSKDMIEDEEYSFKDEDVERLRMARKLEKLRKISAARKVQACFRRFKAYENTLMGKVALRKADEIVEEAGLE